VQQSGRDGESALIVLPQLCARRARGTRPLPGAHYHWVIEQTMTVLNDAAPELRDDTREPTADHNPDETLVLGEIHHLMLEVLRLAHASDALEAHPPINVRSTQPADLTLHDRAWQRLAS
jgi:hypothetical protein